ncbi:MAG: MATE family efflux transporter [Acidobacteria bacterium]|jgi:multidrug resistance protein, MATE family|nr:MATE family efflux transporter [Acidobacteriota bacterium]
MATEGRSMINLAVPVVLAEMGWFAMSIVDTMMVGPLGPAAIGAVGMGGILFMTLMVFGLGTLLALDTFVSQNFGAGRIDECHRWLFAGLQLAAVLSVALMVVAVVGVALLPSFGFHPEILAELVPYTKHLVWSAPPLMAYVVFRRYLQAMNLVRPVMFALVAANVINALVNWVLIFGHLGLPAFGVVGAAYATVASRLVLAVSLFAIILYNERDRPSGLHDVPFDWEWDRVWRLFRLGWPAALQITLEVGVFAAASALAGRIGPLASAANQVVLNIAGFIFMIPFGIGSAAAVRVGQAVGRQDAVGVRRAGWAALGLASGVMVLSAIMFFTIPVTLIRVYTSDPSVIEMGIVLLFICSVFQLFDGLQTVATGALRGLGDTRTAMAFNLVGHWMIGLPIGYWLCFSGGWGVAGLWTGLSIGLILIGASLLVVWHLKSRVSVFVEAS